METPRHLCWLATLLVGCAQSPPAIDPPRPPPPPPPAEASAGTATSVPSAQAIASSTPAERPVPVAKTPTGPEANTCGVSVEPPATAKLWVVRFTYGGVAGFQSERRIYRDGSVRFVEHGKVTHVGKLTDPLRKLLTKHVAGMTPTKAAATAGLPPGGVADAMSEGLTLYDESGAVRGSVPQPWWADVDAIMKAAVRACTPK